MSAFVVGDLVAVTLRGVAHGGSVVGSVDGSPGTTAFVRHGLPGETGTARVTAVRKGGRLVFGDLIDVATASPDRVEPPCPYSGPGACGGCDWQHASLTSQRALKAAVVADSLRRTGRFDPGEVPWDGLVHAVPGDEQGLRWRTRSRFSVSSGGLAMHRHRSADLIGIDDCLIALRPVVEAAARAAAGGPDRASSRGQSAGSAGGREEVAAVANSTGEVHAGPVRELAGLRVHERLGERQFAVAGDGFWQVHPGAPLALTTAVNEALQVGPGDAVLDLYGGVGLFAAGLAAARSITLVEGDRAAAECARENVADVPGCRVIRADVGTWLAQYGVPVDAVVLDPPRDGAGADVIHELDRLRPARVAYVACDPVSLARDLRTAVDLGWRIDHLTALDLFPMTHHVECVASLRPTG